MSETGDAGTTEIDEAIAAWLRSWSGEARRRLIDLGPPALRRAMRLYYRQPVGDLRPRGLDGRGVADGMSVLLGILGEAYPDTFVAEIKALRVRVPRDPNSLERRIFQRIGIDPPRRRWRGPSRR